LSQGKNRWRKQGTLTPKIGPPTPYDPELVESLEFIAEVIGGFDAILDLAERRTATEALTKPMLDLITVPDGFTYEERSVPSLDEAPDITLLIYRPPLSPTPAPVIYMVHGGGMTMGDARLGLDQVLEWASEFNLAVVSVEYRLAPECPFPGPVQDCYAGLVWTVNHAAEFGINPDRVIVSGGSAGAGLGASMVLMARDKGGPSICGQMLNAPMLDDRNDTVSSLQMAGLGIWHHIANEEGWRALLGDAAGTPGVSPYAAAARAEDLSGLPPTFIDVGSAETFRDEAIDFANRIWATGGQAELHVWAGGFHGFTGLAPDAAVSKAAKAAQVDWLRRLLASGS
jgi:acetyl esterase/lipase